MKFEEYVKREMSSHRAKEIIPKRIYNEELSRALYLNFKDPEKFNLRFFSEYFDIDPRELMKLFDSVSYPITKKNEARVFKVYRFVYI